MVSNIIFYYIFTGFFELDLIRPHFFFFFWSGELFIVVLETEPGALNMLGKHSTAELYLYPELNRLK